MKTHYQALGVDRLASADEIKHAFRQQIARYHPDKVQHLGPEFQAMAAERAAELTEAYRILSDANRRAEYDGALAVGTAPQPQAPHTAAAEAPTVAAPTEEPSPPRGFSEERERSGEYVRQAAVTRFRQALTTLGSDDSEERPIAGFDLATVPKPKRFGRGEALRLMVRFVPRVTGQEVSDTWRLAVRSMIPRDEEACVFLIGQAVAPARELADAIAHERLKPVRGGHVTIVPVDSTTWIGHIPTDAPLVARTLLDYLQKQVPGTGRTY